ncbi:transcription elongation factor SPT5 isoform X1 [Lates japonicus]|uniref:Transcription elongation factor SPT5 isoform X1 n=1 Tax=Lates japonicus TaxID=270547 RepID=A0AAD3REP2_LATJO|nr:transcription elongation factor SPT5 isoform X1 [Lates japonicus]
MSFGKQGRSETSYCLNLPTPKSREKFAQFSEISRPRVRESQRQFFQRYEMSDSEDSDFSDNQSERSSDGEAEEVEENEEETGSPVGSDKVADEEGEDLEDEEEYDEEEEEDDDDRPRKKPRHGGFILDEADVDDEYEDEEDQWEEGAEDILEKVNEEAEVSNIDHVVLDEDHSGSRRLQNLWRDSREEALGEYYMRKYAKSSAGEHYSGGSEELSDDITQQQLLPGVKDPNLWTVKCKIGEERATAIALMRKFIAYQFTDTPLQIKSVVAPDHVKGYIYVESYKQTHVKAAIEGIGNLRMGFWNQQMVPIKEMTDVLKVVKEVTNLKPKSWVRLKRGLYKDDIAQELTHDGAEVKANLPEDDPSQIDLDIRAKMGLLDKHTSKQQQFWGGKKWSSEWVGGWIGEQRCVFSLAPRSTSNRTWDWKGCQDSIQDRSATERICQDSEEDVSGRDVDGAVLLFFCDGLCDAGEGRTIDAGATITLATPRECRQRRDAEGSPVATEKAGYSVDVESMVFQHAPSEGGDLTLSASCQASLPLKLDFSCFFHHGRLKRTRLILVGHGMGYFSFDDVRTLMAERAVLAQLTADEIFGEDGSLHGTTVKRRKPSTRKSKRRVNDKIMIVWSNFVGDGWTDRRAPRQQMTLLSGDGASGEVMTVFSETACWAGHACDDRSRARYDGTKDVGINCAATTARCLGRRLGDPDWRFGRPVAAAEPIETALGSPGG